MIMAAWQKTQIAAHVLRIDVLTNLSVVEKNCFPVAKIKTLPGNHVVEFYYKMAGTTGTAPLFANIRRYPSLNYQKGVVNGAVNNISFYAKSIKFFNSVHLRLFRFTNIDFCRPDVRMS